MGPTVFEEITSLFFIYRRAEVKPVIVILLAEGNKENTAFGELPCFEQIREASSRQ